MIAAVVCADKNFGIGHQNELLFHCKEDMKHFKNITTNKENNGSVIVGRKTYESFPTKPLPNRTNIIISHKASKNPKIQKDKTILSSMEAIKVWLQREEVINENNGLYIIGGGQIYKELLPLCERVYITKVLHEYENVDTYFPNIDEMKEWELTSESNVRTTPEGIQYKFCVYDRCDYEIVDIISPDVLPHGVNDIILSVMTFQGYKTVIVRADNDNNLTVYCDTWDYLKDRNNVKKFLVKFLEYTNNNKGE